MPQPPRLLPLLFVVLWSTGFIGARLGLPHAPPLWFLFIRYAAVLALMVPLALVARAPWPASAREWMHIGVTGLLVHAVYLGGVFIAISRGLPAGVASLVVGLQPLLTALAATRLLGQTVAGRQWVGLGMGFVGVGLVVSGKLGTGFGIDALVPAVVALVGITAGTLYQKRHCPRFDWRTGAVAQFLPCALATLVAALLTEPAHLDPTPEFMFALGWLVLVLSIGAISLLNWLIRRGGNIVDVAALFYLVPPCTALIAFALFRETLGGMALLGLGLAVWGVSTTRQR